MMDIFYDTQYYIPSCQYPLSPESLLEDVKACLMANNTPTDIIKGGSPVAVKYTVAITVIRMLAQTFR